MLWDIFCHKTTTAVNATQYPIFVTCSQSCTPVMPTHQLWAPAMHTCQLQCGSDLGVEVQEWVSAWEYHYLWCGWAIAYRWWSWKATLTFIEDGADDADLPISSGEGSPGIIEEDAFNYPDRVEGCQVELDEFVPAPGQKRAPYARLVMHCDKHADCRKHRNITIRSTRAVRACGFFGCLVYHGRPWHGCECPHSQLQA